MRQPATGMPLCLALILLTSAAAADQLRNVKVGQEVPQFTVPTLAGKELDLAGMRGKVVALVYVAAEQQSSERAAQSVFTIDRELRNKDLAVVFLTADVTQVGYFRGQRDRAGIHQPLGLDVGREVYGSLGVFVLPTTIVIDRQGKLAQVISSHKSDYEHVLRAHLRHELGLIDDEELEAELSFEQFQRGLPADKIARHRAAARLLRESGLYDDAEKELRIALEINGEDADTLLDLAALLMVQRRLDETEALLEQVSAIEPNHRQAKLVTGILMYHRDRLDEAQTILEEALLLNPDPIRTHYYLGLIAERRGEETAAIKHFKEALQRLLDESS